MRPGGAVGPAQTQSERTEHHKLLLLPLLIPGAGSRGADRGGRGGDGENSGGEREKHKRQEREKEYVGGGGKAVPPHRVPLQVAEQACVLLEPEEGRYQNQHNTRLTKTTQTSFAWLKVILVPPPECPPPLGVLPPLARRQGPARQYFLSQYRPDPQDETWEDPRAVVRGTLPLELRGELHQQNCPYLIVCLGAFEVHYIGINVAVCVFRGAERPIVGYLDHGP